MDKMCHPAAHPAQILIFLFGQDSSRRLYFVFEHFVIVQLKDESPPQFPLSGFSFAPSASTIGQLARSGSA